MLFVPKQEPFVLLTVTFVSIHLNCGRAEEER